VIRTIAKATNMPSKPEMPIAQRNIQTIIAKQAESASPI
jgi:hypothetical protein